MRLDILSLCNLITRVDYLSRETYAKYTQHSDGVKLFWPLIVVARAP